MSDFPLFVLAMPAVAVALLLFWTTVGKRMMRATDRRYADYQVGVVAQRMGLQIVEGVPSLNLIQAQTTHNMAAGRATGAASPASWATVRRRRGSVWRGRRTGGRPGSCSPPTRSTRTGWPWGSSRRRSSSG
jgi:hypothetical protein